MNTAISHSASDTVASDTLTSAPVATRMNTSGLDSLIAWSHGALFHLSEPKKECYMSVLIFHHYNIQVSLFRIKKNPRSHSKMPAPDYRNRPFQQQPNRFIN